jgi:hypothetical protein
VADAKKSDRKAMTATEVQSRVQRMIESATSFVDGELTPVREKLSKFYHAEKLGNEDENRSQVVMSEVRDGVNAVLPDLLDIFFGPERVVEYEPRGPEDEEGALQATEYIDKAFMEENRGYLITREVLIDGLVRRLGVFKWGWREGETRAARLVGVTQSELQALAEDEDIIEIVHVERTSDGTPEAGEGAEPAQAEGAEPPEPEFTVELTRRVPGRLVVDALPPEEFLFGRDDRDEQTALILAHRTELTRSALLALGVSKAAIEEWGHKDEQLDANEDRIAREVSIGKESGSTGKGDEGGPENDKILYVESWIPMDVDGDGKAELRRICTIGPRTTTRSTNEPADEATFAVWCYDPEPHTSSAWAGRPHDGHAAPRLEIMRSTLDSLALSIFPGMGVVNGRVNMHDVLNNEIGAPIRMDAPGMVAVHRAVRRQGGDAAHRQGERHHRAPHGPEQGRRGARRQRAPELRRRPRSAPP